MAGPDGASTGLNRAGWGAKASHAHTLNVETLMASQGTGALKPSTCQAATKCGGAGVLLYGTLLVGHGPVC